ncbi:hypothetical protein GOP47_0015872 [Adiantum capillus-veneris]|nr:hypothetical protein GOP47_0015872 [Adiantum capillus-veneris]
MLCSGQSAEEQDQNQDQAEPIRCCRTDGKSWQCSNQAQEGSTYCERHQSRCKKGTVKRHARAPCESKQKEKQQTKQYAYAHEQNFSMQLRPRTRDISLKLL